MINIQRLQVTQSAPVLAEKLLLRVPVSVRFSEVPRMLWALDTRTVRRNKTVPILIETSWSCPSKTLEPS